MFRENLSDSRFFFSLQINGLLVAMGLKDPHVYFVSYFSILFFFGTLDVSKP